MGRSPGHAQGPEHIQSPPCLTPPSPPTPGATFLPSTILASLGSSRTEPQQCTAALGSQGSTCPVESPFTQCGCPLAFTDLMVSVHRPREVQHLPKVTQQEEVPRYSALGVMLPKWLSRLAFPQLRACLGAAEGERRKQPVPVTHVSKCHVILGAFPLCHHLHPPPCLPS